MLSTTTTTVCQGLQSCLDPLLFEPGELTHQLAPPKQGISFPWPQKQTEIENSKNSPINSEKSASNWNFIQSLTNNSHNHRQSNDDVTEQVYVHPLVKRSSSSLSTKSLEMCTESLGSETGNGIDSIFDEFSSEKQSSTRIKPAKNLDSSKKIKKSSNFPPPLTSISGNEGVQVKTHREGGRLVIKAFSFSSCTTYFQAERENGRLKLSLLRDGYRDDLAENEEEEEDEVEEENERLR
ncbi:hypothetical protein DH2020_024851 [Rehmannia glutinosa]|uniref:FAF domain-containing protein n=1 Tax=Rehmannia glutinosa TaxID=99300 RepID=A0ABR0W1B1_REHGL